MGKMPAGLRRYWANKRKQGRKVRKTMSKRKGKGKGRRTMPGSIVTWIGVGTGLAKIFFMNAPNYSAGPSVAQDIAAGQLNNVPNKILGHAKDPVTWVLLVGLPVGSKVAGKFLGPIKLTRNIKVLG